MYEHIGDFDIPCRDGCYRRALYAKRRHAKMAVYKYIVQYKVDDY